MILKGRTPLVLVLVLGAVAFAPTLRVGFLWDDHEMIERNPNIRPVSPAAIRRAFTSDVFDGKGDAYFRPVQTLANMVDHRLWGLNPAGYHLTNLAFHLLAAGLLYSILGLAFAARPRLALYAACFFAVHPIIVEQLLIIAGRAELMASAFMFLSIRLAMSPSRGLFAASLVSYAMSCFSKESGVVAPALLFLVGAVNERYRRTWRIYAGYAAVLAIYLVIRREAVPGTLVLPGPSELVMFLVRDFPSVVTHYLGTLMLPTDLHSHRRMLFGWPWMLVSPVFLALLATWAWRRRSAELGFGIAWFAIGLLPKIPLLATNALMLDHWAYLSAVGAWVWLAAGIDRMERQSRYRLAAPAVAGILCALWAGLGWINIGRRDTDKKLYGWALRFPSSSIVRANLGLIYYQEGDFARAEPLLRESLAGNPANANTWNVLALTLWRTGRSEEAVRILDRILAENPGHEQSLRNRDLITGSR